MAEMQTQVLELESNCTNLKTEVKNLETSQVASKGNMEDMKNK